MAGRAPEPRPHAPRWAARATTALSTAGARVRVIASNTPVNLQRELGRLEQAWGAGNASAPSFVYERAPDHAALRGGLEALADDLAERGELGAIYAARARELADEAALCEAAGGPGLWPAARRRYARRDRFDALADATVDAWLGEAPVGEVEAPADDDRVRSDDETAQGSLVRRMREEIGRRRLPLRVVVRQNLASLAATGEGFVQVIAGSALTRRDVERTVLHEIEGHVEPRILSGTAPVGIFAVGTARGSDDQEGRALALERGRGFLDRARRREIALRHVAARSVEAGAPFVDTVRLLAGRGATLPAALRIASRVHRGGGLGREAVYLPALLRVEAALALDRGLDEVLRAGRVSVDAAQALRVWIEPAPAARDATVTTSRPCDARL
jgi:hypothetical protein